MSERKYNYSLAELIDRLAILELKEIFVPDHKKEYANEINDILHDIDLLIEEGHLQWNATLVRAIVILSQFNTHIWYNEGAVRAGTAGNDKLVLTHSINGIRCLAKNIINDKIGDERIDYKTDCLAAEYQQYQPSNFTFSRENYEAKNNGKAGKANRKNKA